MTPNQGSVEINMSGIPVKGIGGLGLVAVAVLMTVVLPAAWWLLVLGAAGGVMLGAVMALMRRHHSPRGPSGDDPTILFRPEPVKGRATAHEDRSQWSRAVAVARAHGAGLTPL
jgi:hypothetical protein